MNKKIIAGLAALAISFTGAYAEELKWVDCSIAEDGTVTIEENLTSKKEGAMVSMIVYYPGKSFENLAPETEVDAVAESNQTFSSVGGEYKFEFKIDGKSDFYTIEIASENPEDAKAFQILYSSPKESAQVLEKLKKAADANEFYDLIYGADEGWKSLGFYLSLSASADNKRVSDILFESVNKFENSADAAACFKKAYVTELLNENKNISLADADSYLDTASAECAAYYGMSYITDEAKKAIINDLKGKGFKNEEEYDKAFLEQVVLKTVKYADGYGRIRDILKDFDVGIDSDEYTNTAYQSVLGKSYADISALKNALDNAKSPLQTTTTGGGSKSSGGGSKSSNPIGNAGFTVDNALIKSPVAVPVEKIYFNDIDNYVWAKDAIESMAKKNIISGREENKFFPSENITREEFTALIVRAFGIKAEDDEIDFSDVQSGAWYADSVKAAASAGVVYGREEKSFGVGERISRQDMAVMLSRAAKLTPKDNDEKFLDDGEISQYAKEAVYTMKTMGYISGFEDNTFRPFELATRAEAAVMIFNVISE